MEPGTLAKGTDAAQLDYAPQPAVGDVMLTRAGGTVIITRRPSVRRTWQALWPLATVTGPILGVLLTGPHALALVSSPGQAVACAAAVVTGLAASLPGLALAIHPIRWEVTAAGITLTARRMTRVVHEVYPRETLIDVRVERVRLKNRLLKQRGVVTVNALGGRLFHTGGRPAELAFIAQAFRDGLGLDRDPLGELAFPPPPPRWRSRVQRRIGRRNVVVTLRPPVLGRLGWSAIAATLAASAAAAVTAKGTHLWVSFALPSVSVPTLAMLALSIPTLLCLTLAYHVRRTVTLEVNDGGLHLSEESLFRPAWESWPFHRLGRFRVDARGRRADLTLLLGGGTSTLLVAGGPSVDVQYMRDTLARSVDRLVSPPPTGPVDWVDIRPR